MANWEKLLHSLGFTDSEAKIYLISLESGPTPVQDLAKKAKVSRVTTYAVIESLMKNGLMTKIQKGKKTLYTAESPERLISFVHGEMKTMEATLREIESSIQDLKLLQRGEKPVVKMYEGKESIKALLEDIIATNPPYIYEFVNIDALSALLSKDDLFHFKTELDRMKIGGKMLYCSKDIYQTRKQGDISSRRIKPGKIFFDGDIVVYKNKVALSTFHGKLITIIIESEILAKTVHALIDLAWQSAESDSQ